MNNEPVDVRAMMVWADQLQEQGDPRGEFITLQCRQAEGPLSKAARRRLFELRRDHHAKLLGNLRGLITRAHFKFGMLHAGTLHFSRKQLEACWSDPLWSRLEILDLAWERAGWFCERQSEFLNSRPSLHTVLHIRAFPSAPCPRITTAGVGGYLPLEDLAQAFPNLKRLSYEVGHSSPSSIWTHPLIRGLEVLLIKSWHHFSAELTWTKGTLCLEASGRVDDALLEMIMRGPPLDRLEVPWSSRFELEGDVEQSRGSRLPDLVDAALMRGAGIVWASDERPARSFRGRFRTDYPTRFIPSF